ncbi:MAG: conserved phage C-terminal domain-containing protein, partial [Chromatiales bacterium]|nr:conserved phage C-terminal domain-containing protein [Chromatiales bacterium]
MFIQPAASPVEILARQRLVLAESALSRHCASRVATRLSLYINTATACASPSPRTLARDSSTSYTSVNRAIKGRPAGLGLLQVEPGDAQHTNRYRALAARHRTDRAHQRRRPQPPTPPTTPTPEATTPPPAAAPAIAQVIDHLNRRADTAFPSTPDSRSHSFVRQALDHQPPEILCAVIDLKADHRAGTDRARYLRPETPFNPAKLEGYLS